MARRRQEVLNVHLAGVLARLGLKAMAEVVEDRRKAPDIVITHPRFATYWARRR